MAIPDLVGSRRVLLRGGVAFVAQEQVGLLFPLLLLRDCFAQCNSLFC